MTEEQEVIVFRIEQEEYAISAEKVKESIRYSQASKLPNAPDWMEVISFRCRLLPAISLSAKFGLPDHQPENRIVLVLEMGSLQIGLIVDEIIEVPTLAFAKIKPTSGGCGEKCSWINGIGKIGNRIIFLLDTARIFTADELNTFKAVDSAWKDSVFGTGTSEQNAS